MDRAPANGERAPSDSAAPPDATWTADPTRDSWAGPWGGDRDGLVELPVRPLLCAIPETAKIHTHQPTSPPRYIVVPILHKKKLIPADNNSLSMKANSNISKAATCAATIYPN